MHMIFDGSIDFFYGCRLVWRHLIGKRPPVVWVSGGDSIRFLKAKKWKPNQKGGNHAGRDRASRLVGGNGAAGDAFGGKLGSSGK